MAYMDDLDENLDEEIYLIEIHGLAGVLAMDDGSVVLVTPETAVLMTVGMDPQGITPN